MLGTIFKGIIGGVFGSGSSSIERVASEWIETDKEKAEAKTLMIKTLDPNGLMRRELSRKVAFLYSWYIFVMLALLAANLFEIGDIERLKVATDAAKEIFMPITTLFGAIVSASFGVNAYNVKKESEK